MHLSDGQIHAYLDRQLPEGEHQQAESHLAGCPRCNAQLEFLAARAERVDGHFTALAPTGGLAPNSPGLPPAGGLPSSGGPAPLDRLQSYIAEKEQNRMSKRIFSPRYRPAWAGIGVVAVLLIALTFPSVRAIANSFLGLFRIQQITVIQVNPDNLPGQLGSSAEFESLLAENIQMEEFGALQEADSAAAASQIAGFPVRLPGSLATERPLLVQPAARLTFTVDQRRAQAILDEIGRSDIRLPDGLDGASVVLDVPAGVTAMLGICPENLEAIDQVPSDPDQPSPPAFVNCTTLLQMPSPTITAPPGLDVAGIGQAFLQVMGMTPEEAESFARNVDWTTTLVIPVPRYFARYQDVLVDGVSGTLVQKGEDGSGGEYLLLWVKDGVLYALTGPGSADEALEIANSLK